MIWYDDWKEVFHLYSQLEHTHDEKNDLENALEHFKKTLQTELENVPSEYPSLLMTYTDFGVSVLHTHEY
jgi:hypothetical protein